MSNGPSRASWAAYAAALWALIFAIFHVIWATGWYVGLDPEQARMAFAKKSFLVYDLVVAGMCVLAVPVALALAMPWGRRLPRRLVGLLAAGGTGLLVLRSVASVVQTLYSAVRGQFVVEATGLWEPWFYLGAILFGLGTWRFWRDRAQLVAAFFVAVGSLGSKAIMAIALSAGAFPLEEIIAVPEHPVEMRIRW